MVIYGKPQKPYNFLKAFSSDSLDFVTIIIIVQFISLELWNEQLA